MMKFIIHNGDEDSIVIEAETIEELREIASRESNKRGWKESNCWSEQIK
jgi:hypothetical protein